MPKKKDPPEDPKEQHKRFKEAAKELDVDQTGRAFDDAFQRAIPPRQPPKKK